MKPYLFTTGTIFGLAGAMHLYALLREWRGLASNPGFAIENGLLCAIGLGLAWWAYRLTRSPDAAG